jgi:5-methylcytosine-specific restriction endonuclease McrA
MATPRKRCTKCRRVLPVTYFSRLSRNRSGYLTICKACRSAARRYTTDSPSRYWISSADGLVPAYYCTACRLVLPATMFRADPRGYTRRKLRCRPCLAAGRRAYNAERLEHVHIVSKAYRDSNPERIHAHQKLARAKMMAHPCQRAKIYAATAAWYAAHPEVIQTKNANRDARMKGAPIRDLTRAEWEAIKAAYDYRCVYCGIRPKRLTMDHIVPLSKGGSHTKSNIVPACKSCNSRKGAGEILVPIQMLLLL